MGHSRRHSALRALYRRDNRGRVSACAFGGGPGWSMLLWTAALFVVVEPIVGHVIEPLLYGLTGRSRGLGDLLDCAVGAHWAHSRNPADRLPGGARPTC